MSIIVWHWVVVVGKGDMCCTLGEMLVCKRLRSFRVVGVMV